MRIYKIADLIVDMEPNGSILSKQSESYLLKLPLDTELTTGVIIETIAKAATEVESNKENIIYKDKDIGEDIDIYITKGKAKNIDKENDIDIDIDITLSEEFLKAKQKLNPHLSNDECEYIWTGSAFYSKLLDFNGFLLHASAVAMDNRAYLFSAKSGTGKSTHTSLWQEVYGAERAIIINDDKPAIRLLKDDFYVYGTPWSGKTNKNINTKVPLGAIIFIERSEENWIKKIDTKQALNLILNQTIRPQQVEKIDKLLILLDKLLKVIPIYKLGCNISEEAVRLVKETIGG